MGKVHGSLARAGKVKGQTPKIDKIEKKKQPRGRWVVPVLWCSLVTGPTKNGGCSVRLFPGSSAEMMAGPASKVVLGCVPESRMCSAQADGVPCLFHTKKLPQLRRACGNRGTGVCVVSFVPTPLSSPIGSHGPLDTNIITSKDHDPVSWCSATARPFVLLLPQTNPPPSSRVVS